MGICQLADASKNKKVVFQLLVFWAVGPGEWNFFKNYILSQKLVILKIILS
jgi:hypothetical protein